MAANFVCGEVKVLPPRSAGIEEIAEVAKKIAREIHATNAHPGETAKTDALLERLRAEYRDFYASFPVVLRWMAQTGQYTPRAMKRYLRWYAKQPFGESHEAFLRAQAEYPVIYLRTTKHPGPEAEAKLRGSLVAALLEEHKSFVQAAEAAERKARESEQSRSDANRARLRELCARLKAADAPPAGSRGPGGGS
jgi:hypothetical protein